MEPVSSQLETDPAEIFPGPVLVVAGPGTGKTQQLARRTRWLVQDRRVERDSITVLTFTGAAARNMRERLSDRDKEKQGVYLPPEQQPSLIRTMHSLGLAIISEKYRKVGLRKGFSVLTDKVLRKTLLADSAQLLGEPRQNSVVVEECRRKGSCEPTEGIKCRICQQYQAILRGCNAIDWDDQIYLACELLTHNAEQLQRWQSKSKYLLVDEYQDINPAQYQLIRLLSRGQEEGLYVVGDDDQSIYSFRGCTPQYVTEFRAHFGEAAKIVDLPICYRCPPHILSAAQAFIKKENLLRRPKGDPKPVSTEPSQILLYNVPSGKYEADLIARKAREAVTSDDVMVLLPWYRFAGPIKKALRRRRIGYDCRHAVDDTGLHVLNRAAAWLKDEADSFALRQCIGWMVQNPDVKIPFPSAPDIGRKREATLAKISQLWSEVAKKRNRKTLWEALAATAGEHKDLMYIKGLLDELRQTHDEDPAASAFLETACRILRPWPSLNALKNEIEEWVEDSRARNMTGGGTLVKIITMQGAKGLGSNHVFVVGLDKDVFPSPDFHDPKEAQRLFYVSMTRAKTQLHLFHARVRKGDTTYMSSPLEASPFLSWLPDENVERINVGPRKGQTSVRK